jgi:hypothetical protein
MMGGIRMRHAIRGLSCVFHWLGLRHWRRDRWGIARPNKSLVGK